MSLPPLGRSPSPTATHAKTGTSGARPAKTGKPTLPAYVWPLLSVWVVVIVLAAIFAPKLTQVVQQEVPVVQGADSLAAYDLVRAEFNGQSDQTILLVFASDTLQVTDAAYKERVEQVLDRVRRVEGVTSIASYYDQKASSLLGRDGRSALAAVSVTSSKQDIIDRLLPALRASLADLRDGPVRFYLTGEAVIASDVRTSSGDALRRSERLAIPLVLITLVIIFASLVAAGIPLALGAVAVAVTSAILYFLTRLMTVDHLAPSMVSMMGMGVGVDYSLFLVSRFREELARGLDKATAMTRTLATSGKAILFSGATVVVSVASVWIVRIDMMRTLSLAVTLVIISAVIGALTFLPCILLLLGKNVDRLALPLGKRRAAAGRGFWHAWAMGIMRRPWLYLLVALVPLVGLALPARGLTTGFALLELVPKECESRQASDLLAAQFEAGLVSPIQVVVRVPTGTVVSEGNLEKLYRFAERLKIDPEVADVIGVTSLQSGWTYSDYQAVFVDAPRRLAESTGNLGKAADGLGQSTAALVEIKAGLERMKAQLGALAQGGAEGAGGAGGPGSPGAGQGAPANLSDLVTNLQAAANGIGQVRAGLGAASTSTTQVAGAISQARTAVANAKTSLDAMGLGAKTDPQYAAAYQSVATALAILDGVNPVTGQSAGTLADGLGQIAGGLDQSATALEEIEKGLGQAASALASATGQAGASGTGAGESGGIDPAEAMSQATGALGQMADALGQVIPGLNEIGGGLRRAADQSASLDLGELMAQSDLPLKLALDQAPEELRRNLEGLVNVDSGSNTAIFKVISRDGPDEMATRDLIGRIREVVGAEALRDGFEVHVGGMPAYLVDFNAELTRALPKVMGLVLVITFLVLTVLLRSVVLPLKAVLMNALSVATSYGLLVLVFQEGHGASLIGLTPLGYLESPIILMLFAALFGLSMDYEVFLLSRVRERYDVLGNNEEAVAEGLEQTAGIITGAAAIMVFVFGAFVFAGLIAMKEFGFGLAVAVALDATLIRLVLAPAFMRLMGDWNWWAPGWLKKILPDPHLNH